MKIGIMGGTFNPIHNAHLLIAEMAREEYGLDRVIFITDGNPPHKSANVTAKQRFEMTHIAIADNSAFEEDDFEINRSEKSYTVNTLGYLKEKYPNNDLFSEKIAKVAYGNDKGRKRKNERSDISYISTRF